MALLMVDLHGRVAAGVSGTGRGGACGPTGVCEQIAVERTHAARPQCTSGWCDVVCSTCLARSGAASFLAQGNAVDVAAGQGSVSNRSVERGM